MNEIAKYNICDENLYDKLYDNTNKQYLKYAYPIADIYLSNFNEISNNEISNDEKLNNKIHTNDTCLICLDESPSILYLPCLHNIVCIACFTKKECIECIMCKNNINFVLLY